MNVKSIQTIDEVVYEMYCIIFKGVTILSDTHLIFLIPRKKKAKNGSQLFIHIVCMKTYISLIDIFSNSIVYHVP